MELRIELQLPEATAIALYQMMKAANRPDAETITPAGMVRLALDGHLQMYELIIADSGPDGGHLRTEHRIQFLRTVAGREYLFGNAFQLSADPAN